MSDIKIRGLDWHIEGANLMLPPGFHAQSRSFRVTLKYEGREETFAYFTGPLVEVGSWDGVDVLECLFHEGDFLESGEEISPRTERKMEANSKRLYALLRSDYVDIREQIYAEEML